MFSKLSKVSCRNVNGKLPAISNNALFNISKNNLSSQDKLEYSRPAQERTVEYGPTKMTSSEAFVETLVSHGVTDVFGIVGSAFMDALDLFPDAGIRFISTQHEQNACHMADGYARISGRHGVCVGQNGPGITNFVTALGAAYYAHSPVVAITPECGTNTKGMGGFQECDQMPIFQPITKYQAHIANPARIPELMSNAFDIAMYENGPTQINIPRDLFYNEMTYTIPEPKNVEYPRAGLESLKKTLNLLLSAKNPVILAGGGVLLSQNKDDCMSNIASLSEFLGCAVATTYLHNDCFPCNHPNAVGSLGYQGSQAAMNAISNADVVLAIGTRMNPFGTLPQYNMDYWPKNAKIIQCDINSRKLGLTKNADCYVNSDCGYFVSDIVKELTRLTNNSNNNVIECLKGNNKETRLQQIQKYKKDWENTLNEWTFERNDLERDGLVRPRKALRELEKAMPENAVVSTDIGNICSVSNSYLRFNNGPSMLAAMTFGNCQYAFGAAMGAKVANPNRPCISYAGDGAWGMSLNEFLTCTRENIPMTAVVFNNEQWGAEKKNQVLWFGDRYIGVQLKNPSFAAIAESMGGKGIKVTKEDEIGDAFKEAIRLQMEDEVPTVLEIMCTRELGDPFRRDAMKLPQRTLAKYQGTTQLNESQTGQPVDL